MVLFGVVILTNSITYSQINNKKHIASIDLQNKHSIYIIAGFKTNSYTAATVSPTTVKVETGFIGFIGYQYWFDNEWSFNLITGLLNAESNVEYLDISSTRIIPVLIGFLYYPQALSLGTAGRVHFGINTGVYIGSASGVKSSLNNLKTGTVNETVWGIEPNMGIDFFVTDWLKIGPVISYHFISDFKEVIGNRKNYSGPVFAFNIGIVL